MVRILGINLPNFKHISIALTLIHGIGKSTALKVCSICCIDSMKKIKDLTDSEIEKLRLEISKLTIEGDLRRTVSVNIKRLIDLGTYRGRRHRRHLPVRGQRTKTNARTCKGTKKPIKV